MKENKDDDNNIEKPLELEKESIEKESIKKESSEKESLEKESDNKENSFRKESFEKEQDNSESSNEINPKIFISDNTIKNISINNKITEENKSEDLLDNFYESDFSSELSLSNLPSKLNEKSINEIFYLTDLKKFNPEEYSIRKYDKNNFELGKLFFKYRYIKEKIERQARKSVLRKTATFKSQSGSILNKRYSLGIKGINHLNMGLSSSINKNEEIFNNKSEYRKYNSDFLVLIEKSIFNFNLKKYEESYNLLFHERIIKSDIEFGEFLLVVNGYNKYILGSFLSKDHPPNDKEVIIKSFINSIDLKYQNKSNKINSFLECLRFLLSRLRLPEDSNLILNIMNTYSISIFNANKDNPEFISKYKSIDAIYLLISTILALNTMLTRKDIKNMNIIKKEQFIEMNKEIDSNEAQEIYEQLEKEPISLKDNYNENNYKRMTILVKKKDRKSNNIHKSKTLKDFHEKDDLNEDKNEIIEDINENIMIDKITENKDNHEIENEENDIYKNNHNYIITEILEENESNISMDQSMRLSSFSYQANLEVFSDKDYEILTKPTKFEKLLLKGSHHPRVFTLIDNNEKLIWAKEIEIIINPDKSIKIKKTKGTVHNILIKEIEDVYIGIYNCEIINEYIKINPNESIEANNFITIKTSYKTICLKADIQENSISWFKALKSLIVLNKKLNKNDKIEDEDKNEKLKKEIQSKIKEIWNEFIIPYWEIYGHFFQYKIQNKINDQYKGNKKDEIISKNGLLDEKTTFSLNDQNKFILNLIKLKENNNNNIYLDYNEFFYIYNFGIPNNFRGKIWTLLIGNPSGITLNMYNYYIDFVQTIDFEELINDYKENQNIEQTLEDLDEEDDNKFIINQILLDIIEIKNYFISKIEEDPDKILSQVYGIVRVFFMIRPDICYNKSMVTFSFIFILLCKDEFTSFKNIFNLICSTNTLEYYIKNENYINIRVKFFEELLEKKIPKVREHFKNLDISTELFLISWFENIFFFTFDYELFKIIFDLYLLNGEYILFQVGLTIIEIQENELLNLTIGEVFKNLNKLPKRYKEEAFLEKLYSNNIYEEYEKWRTDCEVGNQKIKLLELFILESK